MITTDEIKNLAHLGRIQVTDQEVAQYAKDFEAILGYVDQVNQVAVDSVPAEPLQSNVARTDSDPHVPGQ